jgi:DNA-binding LacI/PurR family transcriptional regulator
MDALRSEGISIPHGVSIMGYDGFDESKQYNLTTMRQNIEKVGSTAVDLLLDIVEGRRQQPSHIIVEPELILRSTTGKEGD